MERLLLTSNVAAWAWTTLNGLILVCLMAVFGRIDLRRTREASALYTDEGPDIHSPMPELGGVDLDGRPVRGMDFRGRALAVLLLSPECAPCHQILRELAATRRGLPLPPAFLVVMEAGHAESQALASRYRPPARVIADEGAAVREFLGIPRTPYGFLVDAEGVVRMKGVVNDRSQLEGLVHRQGRYLGKNPFSGGDVPVGGATGKHSEVQKGGREK